MVIFISHCVQPHHNFLNKFNHENIDKYYISFFLFILYDPYMSKLIKSYNYLLAYNKSFTILILYNVRVQ